MKWWLIYLLLTSPGEWENPEGFGPRGMSLLWQCEFLGDYWRNAHPLGDKEDLSCIYALTSDEAVEIARGSRRKAGE